MTGPLGDDIEAAYREGLVEAVDRLKDKARTLVLDSMSNGSFVVTPTVSVTEHGVSATVHIRLKEDGTWEWCEPPKQET